MCQFTAIWCKIHDFGPTFGLNFVPVWTQVVANEGSLTGIGYATIVVPKVLKLMNYVLKLINYVLKVMNYVLKMMNYIKSDERSLKMINSLLKRRVLH